MNEKRAARFQGDASKVGVKLSQPSGKKCAQGTRPLNPVAHSLFYTRVSI